jgi:hypothetical protein
MSRHHVPLQNHCIKLANKSFEYVAKLKYFGTTVTIYNIINEAIKNRLTSRNDCYHATKNLVFSAI